MALPPVVLQPLVLSKKYSLEKDTDLILDRIQSLGYAGIEGGIKDAALYKRKLDERGLKYSATHISISRRPPVKDVIDYLHAVGGADICNSGLLAWEKRSLADYRETIPVLNDFAKQVAREGIRFHYHNHAFEFDVVDGNKTGMDVLLEGLDLSVVTLCVDVAWVFRGGRNPAEFLEEHADKIAYLHLKDTDGTDWLELGKGKLDFKSIIDVMPKLTKVRWAAIEQDATKIEPLESIAVSREYLKTTFGY
jgi:sugar phosphate isomerase/epimerase